jgi:predicted AlkP superfamily pyrophosphatase or phosphodiesterase
MRRAILMLGALATLGCARRPPAPAPRLVVLITVDQMRGDYLTRFGPQFTGGLARLARQGAVFTNAFQDHAVTLTAPGHAATLSGRYPVHTGITSNHEGVGDTTVTMVGPGGHGASPWRFRGTTLVDWISSIQPDARVLSVARKDRGAILPVGRARAPVFWYTGDGKFTTSTYYADSLPDWLQEFNARRLPHAYAGRSWTLMLPDSAYPEPDSVPAERGGRNYTFPHTLPTDSAEAAEWLAAYPWMDELTLDAALSGVRAMDLGAGSQTDLLAISLSTTDVIGHWYGPDSREIHDQILRLDRMLGVFLDSLFSLRDSNSVVIALTGDHGVTSIPGHRAHASSPAGRVVDLDAMLARIHAKLGARRVDPKAFRLDGGMLRVDRLALEGARLDPDSVVKAFRDSLRAIPRVRAELRGELASADTAHDSFSRRWLHQISPTDSTVAMVYTLAPNDHGPKPGGGADHGSPHDEDAHVPLIFYGAPFQPGRYDERVAVVDLAPTLAAVLGVKPLEPVDGRVLSQALRISR